MSHVAARPAQSNPTPIPFSFQTVDDPASSFNQVNGINQLSKIVGSYGGQSSGAIRSYTSQPPYVKFRSFVYPGAQGTVATALSSNKIVVGYVIDPNSLEGTLGFAKLNGVWTLFADPNEGGGSNAVTEVLGVNDSEYAVGFYTNASGVKEPFDLSIATGVFTDLHPPGATAAEATGINGKNDVVGWEATSDGVNGFFLLTGTYYPFSYPGAQATYARSVNWSDQVVGSYLDASGYSHGFLLIGATKRADQQFWQSIDEPKAAEGTWVTGINNHHDICGYYVDASGTQHGFVAVPGK